MVVVLLKIAACSTLKLIIVLLSPHVHISKQSAGNAISKGVRASQCAGHGGILGNLSVVSNWAKCSCSMFPEDWCLSYCIQNDIDLFPVFANAPTLKQRAFGVVVVSGGWTAFPGLDRIY